MFSLSKRIHLVIIGLLFSSFGFGQDTKAIESDLCKSFNKIFNWWDKLRNDPNPNDELIWKSWKADSIFLNKVIYYTNKYPFTLTCNFKNLDTCINILTSTDSLFRIYNWNTWQGGTEVFYNTVFQYNTGDKVKAYSVTGGDVENELTSPDYYYDTLITFKANNKTYYITVRSGKYSTSDFMDELKLYTIENGKLNDTAHLIKTQTGIRNILSYEYRLNDPQKDFYVYKLHFNSADSIIYVPIVQDDGKKTSRFIRYKFKGPYFERIENN